MARLVQCVQRPHQPQRTWSSNLQAMMQAGGRHLSRQCIELIHEIKECCILVWENLLPAHGQNGMRGSASLELLLCSLASLEGDKSSWWRSASAASHVRKPLCHARASPVLKATLRLAIDRHSHMSPSRDSQCYSRGPQILLDLKMNTWR